MKIFSIAFALLLTFCLLAYFIPVPLTTRLAISSSFNNTVSQLIHPDNWKNWYPNIKKSWLADPSSYRLKEDKGGKTFTITVAGINYHVDQRTLLSYEVRDTTGRQPDIFSFALLPTKYPDQVEIIVESKGCLLYRLLPFIQPPTPGVTAIAALRSFLEDPNAWYGFPIAIGKVTDTAYLTTQTVLQKEDLFKSLPRLFSQLGQFIRDKDLRVMGDRSVSYDLTSGDSRHASGDSLHIIAGIPVNRIVPGDDRIACMQMPKGRMLVGSYHGSFAKRSAIYAAMQRYLADHHLSLVASPYERYTDNRLPIDDSSAIDMELYFPIR